MVENKTKHTVVPTCSNTVCHSEQEESSETPHFLVHALFATGRNGEMGNSDGTLPWRTPNNRIRTDLPENIQKQCAEDMAFFKKLTTGNIIIMGYNTYKNFTCPLPSRINIVIDRNTFTKKNTFLFEDEWNFFPSIEEALNACNNFNETSVPTPKDIFIIGGAKLLQEAFSKKIITGKIFHTVIDADFPDATILLVDQNNDYF